MGFHKRNIANSQIYSLHESKNLDGILKLFEGAVDVFSVESGIATRIYELVIKHKSKKTRAEILGLIQIEIEK
jgi:hypothetical protein